MTYDRSIDVQAAMDGIKQRGRINLKGIVTTDEVGRLCGLMRLMLRGRTINEEQREKLTRLTMLCRRFTVAEADYVASIYSLCKLTEARLKLRKSLDKETIPF